MNNFKFIATELEKRIENIRIECSYDMDTKWGDILVDNLLHAVMRISNSATGVIGSTTTFTPMITMDVMIPTEDKSFYSKSIQDITDVLNEINEKTFVNHNEFITISVEAITEGAFVGAINGTDYAIISATFEMQITPDFSRASNTKIFIDGQELNYISNVILSVNHQKDGEVFTDSNGMAIGFTNAISVSLIIDYVEKNEEALHKQILLDSLGVVDRTIKYQIIEDTTTEGAIVSSTEKEFKMEMSDYTRSGAYGDIVRCRVTYSLS